MKFILSLFVLGLATQSFADTETCVDRATAEKALTMFIANDASINGMLADEYFYNYVADDLEPQVDFIQWLADFQSLALQKLVWNTDTSQYETSTMWRYECAPSADCWGGYIVDCQGSAFDWWDGEE